MAFRALVQVEELVTGFKSVILEPETVVLGFGVVRLDGADLLVQSGDDFSSSPKFIRIIPNPDQRFEILGLGSADTQFDLLQGSDENEHHGKAEKSESQAKAGKGASQGRSFLRWDSAQRLLVFVCLLLISGRLACENKWIRESRRSFSFPFRQVFCSLSV